MKNIKKNYLLVLFTICIVVSASFTGAPSTKESNYIPDVKIESLDNEMIESKSILAAEGNTLVVFWATCCAPCLKELTALSTLYPYLKKDYNTEIVAVSVDLPYNKLGVKPFIEKKNWQFPVYFDVNRNLMHKMNATNTPHSFLIGPEGKVLWNKQGFVTGDEDGILSNIETLRP